MDLKELYNQLIEKYPKYKDYIKYNSAEPNICINVVANYQDTIDRIGYLYWNEPVFFYINLESKQSTKVMLYWSALTAKDFFGPSKVNYDGAHRTMDDLDGQEVSIEQLYTKLDTLWPNYEAAVSCFAKVAKEISEYKSILQELGFAKPRWAKDGNMQLRLDTITVQVNFPSPKRLPYAVYVWKGKYGELVAFCESRNFEDCLNFLIKEKN